MAKAFSQYLSNIVNGIKKYLCHHFNLLDLNSVDVGEVKSNTLDSKKSSLAWELKSVGDRSLKREQTLLQNFQQNMNPLDKLVNEFKDKMR